VTKQRLRVEIVRGSIPTHRRYFVTRLDKDPGTGTQ
jgi:hypothetical protein